MKKKQKQKLNFSAALGDERLERLRRIAKARETTMTATVKSLIDEEAERLESK